MTLDEFSKELKELGASLDGYLAWLRGVKDGIESVYKETEGKYGEKEVNLDDLAVDRNMQVQYMVVALQLD